MDSLKIVERTEESPKARKTFNLRQRKFLIAIAVILLVEAPAVISSWITIAEKIMPLLDQQYSSIIELVQQPKK